MRKMVFVLCLMFSVSVFAQVSDVQKAVQTAVQMSVGGKVAASKGSAELGTALFLTKMEMTKESLFASLEEGNAYESKLYAKKLTEDYYFVAELYPLLETAINNGLVPIINCAQGKEALVDLVRNVVPEMMETTVKRGDIIILDNTLRLEVLSSMFKGMLNRTEELCSDAEMADLNKDLDNTRREMIFSENPNYSAISCYAARKLLVTAAE